MNTHLKIAWRNLWRNKRRTIITSASILFGVFFAAFMTSIQKGSMGNMVDNVVRFSTGYIQIQQEKYKDSPGLNHSFSLPSELKHQLQSNDRITAFTQRLESFALASSGEKSFGGLVTGIEPEKEDSISEIRKWVVEGSYLESGDEGALLGSQLAQNLGLKTGDTLAIWGQGYHGATAAGLFVIKGILHFPIQEMNNRLIYIDINRCRELFSTPGKSTSCIIMLRDQSEVHPTLAALKSILPDNLRAYGWNDLQPELQNLIEGKLASGKVITAVLFMIIGFGIWGTIIMLMSERRRELGIMIALGVRKIRAIQIVLFESLFIGVLGIVSGIVATYPLIWYLFNHPIIISGQPAKAYTDMGFEPILKFSIQPEIFFQPAYQVFFIFMLISIYPVVFITRLKTANALHA